MDRAHELFTRLKERGKDALLELIDARATEELFLDFKRSADNGAGRSLHKHDLENLSKAVSAFGNSEGGVIVWGIDCKRGGSGADVADCLIPLQDAQGFVSRLLGAVSGRTVPPHQFVEAFAICEPEGFTGFAVCLVPKWSGEPLQVVGDWRFYIRAGSTSAPAPHGLIAALFGREPRSNIIHQVPITPAVLVPGGVEFFVSICLMNTGIAIARDAFINAYLRSPSTNSLIELQPDDSGQWQQTMNWGMQFSAIAHDGVKIPPGGRLHPMHMHVVLRPPFREQFRITGQVGAANSVTLPFELQCSAEDLDVAWAHIENLAGRPQKDQERELSRFVYRVLGREIPASLR